MSDSKNFFPSQYSGQYPVNLGVPPPPIISNMNPPNVFANSQALPNMNYSQNNQQPYQNLQPGNPFATANPAAATSSTHPYANYRSDSGAQSINRYSQPERYNYNRSENFQSGGRSNITNYDPSVSNVSEYNPYSSSSRNFSEYGPQKQAARNDQPVGRRSVTEFDPDKSRDAVTTYKPPDIPAYVPLADKYREEKKRKSSDGTTHKVETADVLSEVLKHQKPETADPTIENILKSIGFDFELSRKTQEKAKKEREALEIFKKSKTEACEFGIKETDTSSFLDSDLSNVDIKDIFTKDLQKDSNRERGSFSKNRLSEFRTLDHADKDVRQEHHKHPSIRRKDRPFVRNPSPERDEKISRTLTEPHTRFNPNMPAIIANDKRQPLNFKSRNTIMPSSRRSRLNDEPDESEMRARNEMFSNEYCAPSNNRDSKEESNRLASKVNHASDADNIPTRKTDKVMNESFPQAAVEQSEVRHDDEEVMDFYEHQLDSWDNDDFEDSVEHAEGKPAMPGDQHIVNNRELDQSQPLRRNEGDSFTDKIEGNHKTPVHMHDNQQLPFKHPVKDRLNEESTVKSQRNDYSLAHRDTDLKNNEGERLEDNHSATGRDMEKLYKEREEKRCRLSAMESQLEALKQNESKLLKESTKCGEHDSLLKESRQLKSDVLKAIQELKKTIDSNTEKIKDALKTSKRPKLKISGKYTDEGNYWCSCCAVRLSDFGDLFHHLNTASHAKVFTDSRRVIDQKISNEVFEGIGVEGGPVQGAEFLFRVDGYFCDLCKEYIHGRNAAEKHLICDRHNREAREFYNIFPSYNQLRAIDHERKSDRGRVERSSRTESRSNDDREPTRRHDDIPSKCRSYREIDADRERLDSDRTSGRSRISINMKSDISRSAHINAPLPEFEDVQTRKSKESDRSRNRSPERRSKDSGKELHHNQRTSRRNGDDRYPRSTDSQSSNLSSIRNHPNSDRREVHVSKSDIPQVSSSGSSAQDSESAAKPERPGLLPLSLLKRGPRVTSLLGSGPSLLGAGPSKSGIDSSEKAASNSNPITNQMNQTGAAPIRPGRNADVIRSLNQMFKPPDSYNIPARVQRKRPADPQVDIFADNFDAT